jgi:hypothetical protein
LAVEAAPPAVEAAATRAAVKLAAKASPPVEVEPSYVPFMPKLRAREAEEASEDKENERAVEVA